MTEPIQKCTIDNMYQHHDQQLLRHEGTHEIPKTRTRMLIWRKQWYRVENVLNNESILPKMLLLASRPSFLLRKRRPQPMVSYWYPFLTQRTFPSSDDMELQQYARVYFDIGVGSRDLLWQLLKRTWVEDSSGCLFRWIRRRNAYLDQMVMV
jgi:hypothetical protein